VPGLVTGWNPNHRRQLPPPSITHHRTLITHHFPTAMTTETARE
jgi:hypothetical protein